MDLKHEPTPISLQLSLHVIESNQVHQKEEESFFIP